MYVLILLVLSFLTQLNAAPGKLPHIVFMVADDLGWNDVNWREPHMHTPHLNRLAHQGIILNNSYVQKLCSPSRSAFMSGYFPYHTGLQHGVIGANQKAFLPGNLTILPQGLSRLGYSTHIVGKWHLGSCNLKYTPPHRGFDSFLGYYAAAEDYYTHRHGGGLDFWLNDEPHRAAAGKYSAHVFANRTKHLLDNHNKSHPLFLYLPFQSVHAPLEVPPEYEKLPGCAEIQNSSRKAKCGMIAALDEAIGNITQHLESNGFMDNLLLIFTTDNGGPVDFGANNWPLRGAKATLWEGGTRGTGFVYSKNLFKPSAAGTTYEGMMHAVDWFPTIMHLVGGSAPPGIDGVSQWEAIVNGGPSPRTDFVYNIDQLDKSAAIRMGDWKLIKGSPGAHNDWHPVPGSGSQQPATNTGTQFGPESHLLFNIKEDPLETQDVKDKHPVIFNQIKEKLAEWTKSEVPPNFPAADPQAAPARHGGIWSPGWC